MGVIPQSITIDLQDKRGLWDVIYLHTTVVWDSGGRIQGHFKRPIIDHPTVYIYIKIFKHFFK